MSAALSVVISTHRRPGPLREAIDAITRQDFRGTIETVVVFDKEEPDVSLETNDPLRPVRVIPNHRTSGLPGSRNSGVDVATAEVVGFCDDDDLWLPAKASRQLELMERTGAPTVGCAIEVITSGSTYPRRASGSAVRFEDLIRSRVPEAYMSTVLVRRSVFSDHIGPVAEGIPGGFAEDYEWWLRAARWSPVPIVTEPMFQLRWEGQSYFRDKWQNMSDAIDYLIERYPEFSADRRGWARLRAQQAFAVAGAGDRQRSLRTLADAAVHNPLEVRLPFALLAGLGVPAGLVMGWLNRFGRGI